MEAMTEDKALTAEDEGRLDDFYRAMEVESSRSLGYPSNAVFDYSDLYRFLHFPLNNIGDPFVESTFRVHSRSFERDVLRFFAKMYHAPEDDYWGYVTSGGTEGNMYGLYLARELLPEGIVYYSEETHYSVSKVLRVLALRNIMIKTLANGEIDYEDLRETVRIHRDVPPIILANIGTTMKGAVDNVDTIQGILRDFALPNFYIHCDAALSGMILPFVKDPEPYDFAAGIDSISVSGHKMIGSPMPCGVVLAKKKNVDRIARSVEYVGTLDTTISRSRNGLSPLFLWSAIRKLGPSGFREMVVGCLKMADYAIDRLREKDIDAWRNNNSVTVVFPRPATPVLEKWQIAVFRDIGHMITMPHVTRDLVDELVGDIAGTEP
jgi:histidine decarboxylase